MPLPQSPAVAKSLPSAGEMPAALLTKPLLLWQLRSSDLALTQKDMSSTGLLV